MHFELTNKNQQKVLNLWPKRDEIRLKKSIGPWNILVAVAEEVRFIAQKNL